MFDDYFEIVKKHKSIHSSYNQMKEMKRLRELKDKEAKMKEHLK